MVSPEISQTFGSFAYATSHLNQLVLSALSDVIEGTDTLLIPLTGEWQHAQPGACWPFSDLLIFVTSPKHMEGPTKHKEVFLQEAVSSGLKFFFSHTLKGPFF